MDKHLFASSSLTGQRNHKSGLYGMDVGYQQTLFNVPSATVIKIQIIFPLGVVKLCIPPYTPESTSNKAFDQPQKRNRWYLYFKKGLWLS